MTKVSLGCMSGKRRALNELVPTRSSALLSLPFTPRLASRRKVSRKRTDTHKVHIDVSKRPPRTQSSRKSGIWSRRVLPCGAGPRCPAHRRRSLSSSNSGLRLSCVTCWHPISTASNAFAAQWQRVQRMSIGMCSGWRMKWPSGVNVDAQHLQVRPRPFTGNLLLTFIWFTLTNAISCRIKPVINAACTVQYCT